MKVNLRSFKQKVRHNGKQLKSFLTKTSKHNSKGVGDWIKVSKEEVDALPQHSKDLIENHCLFDEDFYFIPDYGFKLVDLVIYLNHSETPNVISLNDGEEFEAIRDIASGEELLVDYGTIVECEE